MKGDLKMTTSLYCIMGSHPGDTIFVRASTPRDAFIKSMMISEGIRRKTAVNALKREQTKVRKTGIRRWQYGDYEILKQLPRKQWL